MQKTPFVFPVIGGRKVEHLHANIGALNIALTREHIRQIEAVVAFDIGFPNNMVVSDPVACACVSATDCYGVLQGTDEDEKDNWFVLMGGHPDRWPARQAIRPSQG